MARRASGLVVVMTGAVSIACGNGIEPSRPLEPTSAAASGPVAVANGAPEIAGEDTCVGPAGQDHVFQLHLRDPDDDVLSFRAVKQQAQGRVDPTSLDRVPSGTTLTLLYSPPGGRDSNQIEVTVTDGRGASATRMLYVRNH